MNVHLNPRDIIQQAARKMDAAMAEFPFTDAKIKEAAGQLVARFRRGVSLGHTVGMEVHDVPYPTNTLEPGQVFTIEPAMTIPDEHLGIRLEDILLITANGYENLSTSVPIEIADIEKLMAGSRPSSLQRR